MIAFAKANAKEPMCGDRGLCAVCVGVEEKALAPFLPFSHVPPT